MNIEWHIKEFHQLSLDELYGILNLRNEVFVVEQNCVYLDTDYKDQHSLHIFLKDGKEILAYSRVYTSDTNKGEISFGRILVKSSSRKRGLAKELLKRTLKCIEDTYGIKPVRIHAQCYLSKFYEEFGFVKSSEEFLEDGIPHVEMVKNN